jgi:hypothetical protein
MIHEESAPPDPSPPPEDRGTPPEDPEEWTDDQWITWLQETDQGPDPNIGSDDNHRPARGQRMTRSAGGVVLGAAMTGLAQALYGPRDDEVAIIEEAPGEPHDDSIEVHLDPDHPEQSVVIVRRNQDQGDDDDHDGDHLEEGPK